MLIWILFLGCNMVLGSLLVMSARILRSLEIHDVPELSIYLYLIRDLYWPISHFLTAVTLSYMLYH
jgi:hypothetical protein